MTFKKRNSVLRFLFNDYIPCPIIGSISLMEVWAVLSIPVIFWVR